MKTLDELQALVNGYKRGSVRFDYLSDVLNGHIDEFVTHPNRGHRPRHTGRT